MMMTMLGIGISVVSSKTDTTVCSVRLFHSTTVTIAIRWGIVKSRRFVQLADGHFTWVCGYCSRCWCAFRQDRRLLPHKHFKNVVSCRFIQPFFNKFTNTYRYTDIQIYRYTDITLCYLLAQWRKSMQNCNLCGTRRLHRFINGSKSAGKSLQNAYFAVVHCAVTMEWP